MSRKLFFSFLLPLCAVVQCFAQDISLLDVIEVEDYDEAQVAEMMENVLELEAQPLNINTARYEDFCRVPGLTLDQISDIMFFRDKYGALRTLEELALIPSIDRTMRLFLSTVLFAEKPERTDSILWKRHHGTVFLNERIPFYTRKGDLEKYLGDKYSYSVKAKGSFGSRLKYGLAASKDAGEPFFTNGNPSGFDHYGLFVNINNVGLLKSLTAGHFRIRMGEGLILNNGYSLGKQYQLSSLGTGATRVSGYASRSDAHYLQGAAATFGYKDVELTAFWSYRDIDATLNDDGSVRTLLTSAYHRTPAEMAKKNNTAEMTTGAHVGWKHNRWHAGASGVYNWYNRPVAMNTASLYRRHYPDGDAFWNASVDYGYLSNRFTIAGETATGSCGDIATVNRLSVLFGSDVRVNAIQRYYSYRYYALLANAFSDGGYTQNESGLYVGINVPLSRKFRVEAYSDYAYFPWARFYTDEASYSWDNSLTLTYDVREWTLQGRYRLRMRERNNANHTAQLPRTENVARFSASRTAGAWMHRTQFDFRTTAFNNKTDRGYMLSQLIVAKLGQIFPSKFFSYFTATGSAGYFNTTDSSTQLYLYERGTLESFSMLSFNGEGIRLSAMLRADFSRRWMLIAKLGFTDYFDRVMISSGDQMVPQSYKTDLDLQLRYKF